MGEAGDPKDSSFLDSSIEISFRGATPEVPMQVELSDIERSVHEEKCEPAGQTDFKDATMKELETVLRECLQEEEAPLQCFEDFKIRPDLPPRESSPEVCIVTRKEPGSKPSSKSTLPSDDFEPRRRKQDIEIGEPFVANWNCGVCITYSQERETGCTVLCVNLGSNVMTTVWVNFDTRQDPCVSLFPGLHNSPFNHIKERAFDLSVPSLYDAV